MKNNAEKAFTKSLWLTIALHFFVWAWIVFFSFSRSSIVIDLGGGGNVLEMVDVGQKPQNVGIKEEKPASIEQQIMPQPPQETIPTPIASEATPIVQKEPANKPKPIKPEKKPLEQVSYEKFLQQHSKTINANKKPTPSKKTAPKPANPSSFVRPKVSISGVTGNPKTSTNTGNSAQGKGIGSGSGTGSGPTSILGQYVSNIRRHIEAAWVHQEINTKKFLKATVRFKVTASGKITDCKIITPSQDPHFDRALLELFNQLPLLPPPDNSSHTFQLSFEQD